MLAAALATFLLAFAQTYPQMLLAALGVGLAGGSFAVGVTYVSRFFPQEKQGTALGIFGAGNVGRRGHQVCSRPSCCSPGAGRGSRLIWAAVLAVMAAVFWFTTSDDPVIKGQVGRRETRIVPTSSRRSRTCRSGASRSITSSLSAAFVALALWLPRYLIGVYGFDITTAGMIAAAFSIPGSIFRAYGGALSDRIGARTVMYWTFASPRSARSSSRYPPTDFVAQGIEGGSAFTSPSVPPPSSS